MSNETDTAQGQPTVKTRPPAREPMAGRKAAIILSLILLVSLAVRLLCFSGVGISDSLGYVWAGGNAAEGKYPWEEYPFVYIRPGFVLPLAVLVSWWGYGLWTPALYNLACSLGLVVLTYAIGRMLFDRKAGLWAAAVIAVSTMAIGNGTGVVPDTPQAFFCALSIALALIAARKSGGSRVSGLCFAAGVALGMAWLVKCTSVFVAPALLLIVLRMRQHRRLAIIFGLVGFGLIFLSEMAFWASVSGYPLERFRVLFPSGSAAALDTTDPFFSLWEYPIKMFVIISADGLFYYLLVPAVLWSAVRARRRAAVALVWLAVFFLFLQFGSLSFTEYKPFYHQPRYLMPLVPAGAILAGAWLCTVARKHARIAGALYLLYAVPSLLLAYVSPLTTHTPAVAAKAAVDILEGRQAREVYSDRAFASAMNYFRRNDPRQLPKVSRWLEYDLKPTVDPAARPGAHVVRFDGTLRRIARGPDADATLDRIHAGIEAAASTERIPLQYGRPQRAVMRWIWRLLRKAPLPERASRRLQSAFSRHLAEPVVVIYRIRGRGEEPASAPGRGAGSSSPSRVADESDG